MKKQRSELGAPLMNEAKRCERREAVSRIRRKAGAKIQYLVPAFYDSANPPFAGRMPAELLVAATTAKGELSGWCSEAWWNDRLSLWAYASLELIVLPTPGALLHSALQSHLFLVRRVACDWRIVGQTDGSGLASASAVDRLLNSAYDEIQFLIGRRTLGAGGGKARSFSRISAVMGETIAVRERRRQGRPTIAWICDPREVPEDSTRELERRARELRVDRFESNSQAGQV